MNAEFYSSKLVPTTIFSTRLFHYFLKKLVDSDRLAFITTSNVWYWRRADLGGGTKILFS